jgi:hypothetical protein
VEPVSLLPGIIVGIWIGSTLLAIPMAVAFRVQVSEYTQYRSTLLAIPKEVIKELPTSRNLSATAARVPRCSMFMPSCSFSDIFFGYSHLTSPHT